MPMFGYETWTMRKADITGWRFEKCEFEQKRRQKRDC